MTTDAERLLVVLRKLGEIWGRTRFQKIVFLLKKRFEIDFTYNFIPYFYGPYSRELQFDIDLLEHIDVIQVEPSDGTPYLHALTQKGLQLAEKIEQEMEPDKLRRLDEAIKLIRPMSTDDLVKEAKREANIQVL